MPQLDFQHLLADDFDSDKLRLYVAQVQIFLSGGDQCPAHSEFGRRGRTNAKKETQR